MSTATLSIPDRASFSLTQVKTLLLALATISCLVLVFVIPPFQAPDEQQHFYRTYAVATGKLMPEVRAEGVGYELPASLPATVEVLLRSNELHAYRPVFKVDSEALAAERQRPLDPDNTRFVSFPDASLIGATAYLPQALGLSVGRMVGASPVEMLYLGRLANALVALAICWFAITRLTVGTTLAATILALPMVQASFATLAPDATLISAGFLMIALASTPEGASPSSDLRLWVAVTLLGLLMITTKLTYIAAAGFGALLWWYRDPVSLKDRRTLLLVANWLLLFVAGITWMGIIDYAVVTTRPNVDIDADRQIAHIVADPVRFVGVMVGSMLSHAIFYVESTIGLLGWKTVKLGNLAYLCGMAALALAVLRHEPARRRFAWWMSLLALGAVLLGWVLTESALYIRWSEVGSKFIEGMQGRYFLPMLFALVLLQNRLRPLPLVPGRVHDLAIVALMAAVTLGAHLALMQAYW